MRHPAFSRLAPCAMLGAIAALSGVARAEEPRKVTEPSVLRESAEVTSVADAFDDDDKFDLHLTLGFQQTWKSGKVMRESNSDLPQFSSGGYVAGNQSVANYSESTSRLNTRADIGVYKDIALVLRMPIILSNDRKLEATNGSDAHQSVILQGAPGEQLFSLPFESPTRSGIEYFAVGLDVAPMNQQRDRTKPTWVIGVEGRFSVAEPMHACTKAPNLNLPANAQFPQQSCAYPSDIDRDGVPKEFRESPTSNAYLDGTNFNGHRDPGVSRGTTGLQVHTYISKRTKYIEPYSGFEALFEFQNGSSDYGATDLQGSLVNHPPFQGTLLGGIAVIPWEVRDQFQRIELDFRASGTYRSEGRDYSPLFDALGSSDAPSLRRPNYAAFNCDHPNTCNVGGTGTSVANTSSEKVYTTGITDVQQHGIYRLSAQFTFQAGEYVKFNVGAGFTAEQGHVITLDQPCNPDFSKDPGTAGPCHSSGSKGTPAATGIPNPNYRPVIDTPGRRFRFDDGTLVDAWVNAIVMF
ncbi:MAG TPA: hypothetical protein VHE30_25055 [Polyangiaceae bacterium]|nr:hypothetical protein [Polyangiaceae bacterium]